MAPSMPHFLSSLFSRQEHSYQSLSNGSAPDAPRWASDPAQGGKSRKAKIIVGAAGGLFILLLLSLGLSSSSYHQRKLGDPLRDDRPTHLRLVVSARDRGPNVCKTLLSSAALGYPTPALVNWEEKKEEQPSRIKGILRYFKELPSTADDDLVILITRPQMWFQLRPETLVHRYFEVIKGQDKRLNSLYGTAVEKEKYQQKVLFAAQKSCAPASPDDPACYAVPESTLPETVYGLKTDQEEADPPDGSSKIRQRYINAGAVVGPAVALRAILERALVKAEKEGNTLTDDAIFSEMYGEQEIQRHVARERDLSRVDRFKDWQAKKLGNYFNILDPATAGTHKLMKLKPGDNYEFGIGLDYGMSVVHATGSAEFDTEWIRFEDTQHVAQLSQDLGIEKIKAELLPRDITATAPPYSTYYDHSVLDGDEVVKGRWSNASLFTNLWTGTTPAMIYHDTQRSELTERLITQWNLTWFQPHLRALLDLRTLEPARPVVIAEINGKSHAWWSESTVKQGAMTGTNSAGRQLNFDWLCMEEHEEVFRDDKGPWVDPRRFPNEGNVIIGAPGRETYNGDNDQ